MGRLEHISKKALLLIMGSLFLISCHTNGNRPGPYAIVVDSLQIKDKLDFLYDYEAIIEGVYFVHNANGQTYMATLKDRQTMALLNFADISDSSIIRLGFEANTLAVKDSNIFVFANDLSAIQKWVVSSGKATKKETRALPATGIDHFFIASNIHTPIEVIDDFDFLIPYRVDSRWINKNMVDTFAYLRLQPDKDTTARPYKIIQYPGRYLSEYEFYYHPIVGYQQQQHRIYYTFQSQPELSWTSLDGTTRDKITLPEFTQVKFRQEKKNDFTYLRSYMSQSDVNTKIFCDDDQHVWLITNNRKDNPYQTTIHCYDDRLKELQVIDLETELNTEISFIKHNKLYIYVSHSGNRFITFSLINRM